MSTTEASKTLAAIDHLDIWAGAWQKKAGTGRGKNGKLTPYGIQKLRELILELAVRGRLVPQDPNDEPASVLLERIAKEKMRLVKEGKIKKPKKLTEISENESYDVPSKWAWVRFGEVAQHNAGKTLDKRRNTGISRNYITTSNVDWGYFDLSEVRQMLIREEELEKCTAKKGDLLICEGGEAGRSAVWESEEEICFQNHVHRARFYCEISPYYIYRVLEKLSFTGELNHYRKGVGISNMSGKALSTIPIPLPPLAEQHRIIAKVDELMALCDRLEQEQTDSLEAHQTLVESLLRTLTDAPDAEATQQAWTRIAQHFDTLFTTEHSIDQLKQTILQLAVMGKLVPQDPSDEPAKNLLDRIAEEKKRLVKEGKIKKAPKLDPIKDELAPFELPENWEWAYVWDISELITSGSRDWAKYYSETGSIFVTMGNLSRGDYKLRMDNIRYVKPPLEGEGTRTRLEANDLLISILTRQ